MQREIGEWIAGPFLGGWQDDHAKKDLKESERAIGQDAPACRCALAHRYLLLGIPAKLHQRTHHFRAHSDGFQPVASPQLCLISLGAVTWRLQMQPNLEESWPGAPYARRTETGTGRPNQGNDSTNSRELQTSKLKIDALLKRSILQRK